MDLDLLLAVFFAIILIIIAIEYDDGFILFIMGFLSLGILINLYELFEIIQTSYNNFGNLLQLVYLFIAVFCFVKMILTARQDGIFSSIRGSNARK